MDQYFEQVINKAKSVINGLGCEFAEIRLTSAIGTYITLSGKETDSFSSGESLGGSVRVLKNGAWGFVTFNNLDDVDTFALRAVDIASRLKVKEPSKVVLAGAVKKQFKTEMKRDFRTVPIEEKFQLIKGYNNILESPESVQTTRATYRDFHTFYSYLNSEGSDILYDRSYCGISLASVAKDGPVIQPFSSSFAGYGGFELTQNREPLAEDVVKTAVDLLKAESVGGGTHRVVADPKLSGVFIHEAFGHLSEADFVHENEQMKELMILGKEFGPAELNVVDDGNVEGLSGFIPCDDEGVVPEKTWLIKNGILSGRLHSRETAAKMDEELTGNGRALNAMRQPIVRMSNTYIENGKHSTGEIFDELEDGIYAVDVIGGQTNLEMFTFTSGYGFEIKNGKRGKMFKDIVLSGNVFTTLKNIEMIGNDRQMFGGLGGCGKGGQSPLPVSFGGPHMLIKDVLIGGKQ